HALPHVVVNDTTTTSETPIVTGSLPFALEAEQELRVTIDGVTYSSNTLNEVVVDPLNNTWYVQVSTPLTAGTFDVKAAVWNADGSLAAQDVTLRELTITDAPTVNFGGSGGASNKATALTI